jgi:hypothetical protein
MRSKMTSSPPSLFFSFWLRGDDSTAHSAPEVLQHNLRVISGFGDVWYIFTDNFQGWSQEKVFRYFFPGAIDVRRCFVHWVVTVR